LLVRPAARDEITKADAPSAAGKPMFALESGDATLILQYDLDRDHIAFIGVPRAVPVAAPVVAPEPPQPVPETAAATPVPAAVQTPEPPVQKAEPSVQKPEPAGLQIVEPQLPRVLKPAAPAAPPAATARAPEAPPLLRKSGPCEIKPVMTDQDLVNCGATPR
jgi:hypothetical protein